MTTLDVLSQGRAYLGIGAAWNDEESAGMGLPFPSTKERFERLEEALQIHKQLWSDDDGAYEGTHYTLARTMNVPQPVRKPHVPILIGGGGEKKTLRLVAQYADACNLFGGPELEHKLDVLKGHCDDLGRDYDEIEKTVMTQIDVDAAGRRDRSNDLKPFADLGVTHVHVGPRGPEPMRMVEFLGEQVIPAAPNSDAPVRSDGSGPDGHSCEAHAVTLMIGDPPTKEMHAHS